MQKNDEFIEDMLRSLPVRKPSAGFGRPSTFRSTISPARADHTLYTKFRNMPWQLKTLISAGAAAILLAMCVPFSLMSSSALAQVVEQIRDAESLEFDETVTAINSQEQLSRSHHLYRAGGKHRVDYSDGSAAGQAVVVDTEEKRVLLINAKTKTASVTDLKQTPAADFAIETIRMIRELKPQEGVAIGEKPMGGATAKGFRFGDGVNQKTLWIDAANGKPLQIEITRGPSPDQRVRLTWSNIKMDSKIDEGLFATEIPGGFAVQPALPVDPSAAPAEHFAALMRMYAERNGGNFPDDLREGLRSLASQIVADRDSGADHEIRMLEASIRSAAISAVLSGQRGFRWEYFPGRKLGDNDDIIFFVNDRKQAGIYEVVFGDLSVKTMSKEDLPSRNSE